ncbi:MAG: adenylate/guanylate cyclase domain-containing protein [Acidimicrobiia bacterium]|nr:adenylate/guanylate cyclase domain-containing protein [Acidimicrobiia bacterium]
MNDSLPTGTVTFLFSDVEGSTRLWEDHHEEMRTALAAHDKVMRSAIEDNEGHVFSTAGDAYSAAFARPNAALQAAITAQTGLAEIFVDGSQVKVRMAVHTGSADERDGDYFGPAVNRVARLMSVGNGGQILVSAATAQLAQDSLPSGAALDDLGEHRLKDLSRPEQVYQLVHDSIAGDQRPLRSLDAFPHNLPIQLTSFVGREQEVEEVTKLLTGSRMVTLAGVGGAGKTRLAIHTAAELLANFENGVWLVELAAITDPTRIPATVMDVLGIEEKASEEPMATVTRALAKRQILLVLDNCEHLVDPAARFAAAALGAGTGVTILATSREMLGVPGEYPFQVKSLASPESLDDEVRAALLRYPAVQLFSERGELARPGWRVTAENSASVVQICQRLDGMPLAIELAAARLRMMRADQIAERLDDRFRLLTGGSRTVLPRQQTLEAAIDWSFDLLSDDEKTLFGRLAVFMGGFTLEAAEAVCGIEPLDPYAVLDHIGHLVDKSLVQAEEKEDGVRYRMLETLRQYARQRLADSEEVEGMRRRHADYFRSLVEEAEPNLRGQDEAYWFRRLDDELDNIRQAMSWALDARQPATAQVMAGSLYRYFMYRFRFMEGRDWAERAVAASDEPTPERAKALLAAGTLAQFSLDIDASVEHLEEALEMARSQGLDGVLSPALNNLANAYSGLGMREKALEYYEEHLAHARREGSPDGVIIALHNIASTRHDMGEPEEAIRLAEEALQESVKLGSKRMIHNSRQFLLNPLEDLGDFDRMETEIDAIRALESDLGTEFAPGLVAAWDAFVRLGRGAIDDAVTSFIDGLQTFRGIPDPYELAYVIALQLVRGAELVHRVGRSHVAATLLGTSRAILDEKGYVRDGYDGRRAKMVEDMVRETIGSHEFDLAYAEGVAMDSRDAHDILLSALEEHQRG